jgi:hypothetical protein
MFRRTKNNVKKLLYIICIFSLIVSCEVQVAYPQKIKHEKPEKVKGRVFARINLFTYGSGVGPRYQSFIYQIESNQENRGTQTQLVRVIYQFFDMKDRLDKSFFDFSKEYELLLNRDTSCDEIPNDFGYQRTGEADNRVSILKILAGADKALLQENQIMPCYILKASNFK